MTVPSNWSETLLQYIRKWKAVTDRAEQEEYLGDRLFDNFVLKSGTSSQLAMPANLQKWSRLARWLVVARGSFDR